MEIHELWFSILSLLAQDGYSQLGRITPTSTGEYRCNCLFCGGKKLRKDMAINLDTEAWYCFSCGKGGHGGVSLYAEVYNLSWHDAKDEVYKRLNISSEHSPIVRHAATPNLSLDVSTAETATPEVLDVANREFLRNLRLSEQHKSNMLNRGLDEIEISKLGYKTLMGTKNPDSTKLIWQISDDLERKEIKRDGVAPWYKTSKQGKWFLNLPNCETMIAPYLSLHNELTGFQGRLNDEDLKDGQGKYIWLSSNGKNCGAKPAGMVGYECDFEKIDGTTYPKFFTGKSGKKYLCVTEGVIKGGVAHMISGKPFACLPGVGIQKDFLKDLPELKKIGVTDMILCFDIDQLMNVNVMVQLDLLMSKLREAKFNVTNGTVWDINYKTASGEIRQFNLASDFVFTRESLAEAIKEERLNNILSLLVEHGRKSVYFAIPDQFEEKDKELYIILLNAAKNDKMEGCQYIQYRMKYKGIDDYYAGTQRNIEYV